MSPRSRLLVSSALLGALLPASAFAQDVVLDTVVVEGQGAATGATGSVTAGGEAVGPVDGYVANRSTTGSKTNTPIAEIPQSVSVIGREELDDRAVTKVDEALRYTAGVTSQPFGRDADTDWFYIRGFDATQTGVFLDGLNLYQTGFAGFKIDPFFLERVEVLKGPASVLYGGANPGGIVNLVRKRANGERLRYVEGTLSDNPAGSFGFDVGDRSVQNEALSYRVTGRLAGGEDTQVDYAGQFLGMIAPQLSWQPDADTRLDVFGFFQYDKQNHGNGFFPYEGTVVDAPFGRIPRSLFISDPEVDDFMSRQTLVGYEFETSPQDGVTLRSNTRYSRAERQEYGPYPYGYTNPGAAFGFAAEPTSPFSELTRIAFGHDTVSDQFGTDNSATFEFATGAVDNTLLAGIDYKFFRVDEEQASGSGSDLSPINPRYSTERAALSTYLDDRIDLHQLGLYAQEQARFGGGFVATFNGRYDTVWRDVDDFLPADNDYDDREGALSGRAGLAYEFSNGLTPYVSVASFFNPQLGTITRNGVATPVDNQTGEQIEGGVKYVPTFLDASVTASVFEITQNGVLQSNPATFLPDVQREVRSRGFEFEARANVTDNIKIVGAFTALDLEIVGDINPDLVGNQPFLIPDTQASLWADYTVIGGPVDGLSFGAGVRYVGESFADNQNTLTVPDVTLVDAAIRYEKDDWGLSLNANNLTDKRFVSGCQTALVCSYGEGREVVLKAHVNF